MNGIKSFRVIKQNSLVEELVDYIEEELPYFTVSDEFTNVVKKKKNENQHSLAFCLFMTNKCKSRFSFVRENSQKASSTVDIGVYSGCNIIFTIEAKVLPTPKGTTQTPRCEYEYVYGKGAGIQRFKEGKHGLNNNDEYIVENGLLAYVKQFDYKYWFDKINNWILEAGWDNTEKLELSYLDEKEFAKSISNHKRKNGENLKLHHFWIKV